MVENTKAVNDKVEFIPLKLDQVLNRIFEEEDKKSEEYHLHQARLDFARRLRESFRLRRKYPARQRGDQRHYLLVDPG